MLHLQITESILCGKPPFSNLHNSVITTTPSCHRHTKTKRTYFLQKWHCMPTQKRVSTSSMLQISLIIHLLSCKDFHAYANKCFANNSRGKQTKPTSHAHLMAFEKAGFHLYDIHCHVGQRMEVKERRGSLSHLHPQSEDAICLWCHLSTLSSPWTIGHWAQPQRNPPSCFTKSLPSFKTMLRCDELRKDSGEVRVSELMEQS